MRYVPKFTESFIYIVFDAIVQVWGGPLRKFRAIQDFWLACRGVQVLGWLYQADTWAPSTEGRQSFPSDITLTAQLPKAKQTELCETRGSVMNDGKV